MVSRKRLSDGKIAQQSKYRAAIPISQARPCNIKHQKSRLIALPELCGICYISPDFLVLCPATADASVQGMLFSGAMDRSVGHPLCLATVTTR